MTRNFLIVQKIFKQIHIHVLELRLVIYRGKGMDSYRIIDKHKEKKQIERKKKGERYLILRSRLSFKTLL